MTSLYTPLLLLSLAVGASTQTLGQDVCVCSPGAYGITLDFSLVCPPTNITNSDPGIRDTSCLISQFGSPGATDLVPASVDRIDVLEIREDSTLILRNEISGPFSDGDTITYTTSSIGNTASITDIPFGIQFNTHAFNAAGEPLLNVLSIEYTNECDVYPVIRADQTAGWLRFTGLDPPQSGLCPAAESPAPSVFSSASPTGAPTTTGSNPPTVFLVSEGPSTIGADTPAPTFVPVSSEAPSVATAVTPSPTISTEAPVPSPTEAPVSSPTEAPLASPTEAPVASPTEAPLASPTEAPVASPTEPPVDLPVPDPTPSPTTAPKPTSPSTPMPIHGGMSMSMSMVMMDVEEMLDMEDKLDAAFHQFEEFEEFGRMGEMDNASHSKSSSKSSEKSSKKYGQSRNVAAPSAKSSSESYRYTKKYSKRS